MVAEQQRFIHKQIVQLAILSPTTILSLSDFRTELSER